MKLVERLAVSTKSGEVDWKTSVAPNVFQVSFRDNTLRIGTKTRVGVAEPDIFIERLNKDGEVVERFSDVDLPKIPGPPPVHWYKTMLDLFEEARRKALGADKVLEDILKQLDGDIPL